MGLASDLGARGACDFRSDPLTLCMMEYEDWRPEPRVWTEQEQQYSCGLASNQGLQGIISALLDGL